MTQANVELARHNMVEQQIRPNNVLDQKVLDVIARSPREDYMPEAYRNAAYCDMSIPLGNDEYVLTPRLEGKILQALQIKPTDKILEVGTGSGHLTSLLAQLGEHVISVELDAGLAATAKNTLAAHDINNVTVEQGDAARGWDAHQPYDVIVLTGSLPLLPDSFRETLTFGGRLFVIVGKSPVMEATLVTRLDEEHWRSEVLFDADVPPLHNAVQPKRFEF